MLGALKYRGRRLLKRLERASSLRKSAAADPEAGREVTAALDAFLQREGASSAREELFAAIVRRFAAHHPPPSQVKAMFNAVLEYIVAPMHHSLFWGDRMLTLDKATGFFEEEAFSSRYRGCSGLTHLRFLRSATYDFMAFAYLGLGSAKRDCAQRRSRGMRCIQGRHVLGHCVHSWR